MRQLKRLFAVILAAALLFLGCVPGEYDISNVQASESTYTGVTKTCSKKGVQINYNMWTDLKDLGISEAFFNFTFNDILSPTPTSISYAYNGQTYYFNEANISTYDNYVKMLTDDGINVTVAIVNPYNPNFPDLYYPGVTKHSGTVYYGINTATPAGKNIVEATVHFLAGRYNGGDKGLIGSYIVGNEVNDNVQYNYVGEMDINKYVNIYFDTFKTIYSAVKAENGSAKVYIPLVGRWNLVNNTKNYAGKDLLTKFNDLAKANGVDWNLAYHAYSYPLTRANILRDGESQLNQNGKNTLGGEILMNQSTHWISMKNINVLTDFMQLPTMLNANGQVRSIILSEQGYTSTSNYMNTNETVQAANIAYAYYMAEMNPYIDAFILNGQVDTSVESKFFKFGLWNADANGNAASRKLAYNVYKYIDTDKSLAVTEFAKATLGINDWSEAVPNFDAAKFSSLRSITNSSLISVPASSNATGGSTLANGVASGFWSTTYNTHGIASVDYSGVNHPNGLVVMNGDAYKYQYQVISHVFSSPLDCSATPYLGLGLTMLPNPAVPKYSSAKQEQVRIRVYSGDSVFDANAVVNTGAKSYLFVDLSSWPKKNAINKLEVWFQEQGTDQLFHGVVDIAETMTAASLTGSTVLPVNADTNIKAIGPDGTYALKNPYNYNLAVANGPTAFLDVKNGLYYTDAVRWAVDKNVTTGTAPDQFKPEASCTRAQVVTFLWRAYGCPEPTVSSNPFMDVQDPSQYYYKAVLWAYGANVTTGKTSTRFAPNDKVTRAEFVTFLWRAQGKPAPTKVSPFADVAGNQYYYSPVAWASETGVTTGTTPTTFKPNAACTRGQVVTFIYRALK